MASRRESTFNWEFAMTRVGVRRTLRGRGSINGVAAVVVATVAAGATAVFVWIAMRHFV